MKFRIILSLLLFIATATGFADCILTSSGKPAHGLADPISVLLETHCAKDVFEFREKVKKVGLTLTTHMVANEGFHNPSNGNFSFFEMVAGKLGTTQIKPGDFFFGHFTTVNDHNQLTADQGPGTRLKIEAFAWDAHKELFNFYELMGNGTHNQWFYRGDSADIYADVTLLHRQPDLANPQFGSRLRCSGCHSAGGPIMKEIHAPYNDWWEPKRKLDFGGRQFNFSIKDMMERLAAPDRLAESVTLGIKRIMGSKSLTLSLQEKLRPLFCPVEINFMSDTNPNEIKNNLISIPLEFFVNNKLNTNHAPIYISRNDYENALAVNKSHFPGTSLADSDHAWLTPVKATSDQVAIEHLIEVGLIDEKFANDVLSVDMTNPVFSAARCQLLKYIPQTGSSHWQEEFIIQLKKANTKTSNELLSHLNNSSHTPEYHQQQANKLLMNCREKLGKEENVKKLFLLLAQRRVEIKTSEISKNRLGQILEPGFKVVFPETAIHSVPGKLLLTEGCEVITAE